MLRLMMELRGRFSMKMVRKGLFAEKYFDEGRFLSVEVDPVTGNVRSISLSLSLSPFLSIP